MRKMTVGLLTLALGTTCVPVRVACAEDAPTPSLAIVYSRIADSILANNQAEDAIVRAILREERDRALAELDAAAAESGGTGHLRTAAAHIGDFATEGGAAVEPIRNRLLQGGHHHNSDDTGPDAVYDEGYVVLTKKLKQEALALAKRCAKAAETGAVDAKEVAAIREGLTALATRVFATK